MNFLTTEFIVQQKSLLTGAASADMNVNGSSTAVEFYYTPVDKIVLIDSISLLMEDAGSSPFSSFGALSGLTNGLKVEALVGAKTYEIMRIKTNADILTKFDRCYNGNGSSDTLGAANGFGNSVDWVHAKYEFSPTRLALEGADKIRVVVQDNLTNIGTLLMGVKFLEAK